MLGVTASGFEQRALRYQAGLEIAPKRHQELARQRHDRNAPDPPLQDAHPFAEPDAQGAVGLVAQPQPSELDHGFARLGVAGLADSLLARHRPTAERTGREADVTSHLAAVVERSIEHLAHQYGRQLGADTATERPAINVLARLIESPRQSA